MDSFSSFTTNEQEDKVRPKEKNSAANLYSSLAFQLSVVCLAYWFYLSYCM